jgi:uncharacterized membrane protein (UPF0127 family)
MKQKRKETNKKMGKTKKVLVAICIVEVLSLCTMLYFHGAILDAMYSVQQSIVPPPHMRAVATPQKEIAGKRISQMIAGGKTFKTEVAATESSRELGLSGRDSIAADYAMLFVFDFPDYHGFWMKDMKFAIDMIWLDADKKIIYMKKDVKPETYPEGYRPDKKDSYVVEVAAGTSDQLGLKVGDTVMFQ